MQPRSIVATLMLSVWALPVPAANVVPESVHNTAVRLRDQALTNTAAYEIVASLTMEVGPRSAGSEGDRAAVAWGLDSLRRFGFSNVRAEPVTVPHWERGTLSVEIIQPFPQTLVAASLGGSVGTSETGVTAPLLAVTDLDDLATRSESEVRGNIVYFSQRMERKRDGSGYATAVLSRRDGPAEAAKRGAVAAVIRSIGTSTDRIAHTGMTKYQDGIAKIPAIAVSNGDADILDYQIATGAPVILNIISTARSLPMRRSANVIGEIPGRDPDAGIVLLGAHLDSWDLGTGALDDGAGVAIVIETARLIAALPRKPRRSIRVVLFANEEFGLSGAKTYLETHRKELKNHVVGLEADSGSAEVWQLASKVAPEELAAISDLAVLLEPLGIERGDNETGSGADLEPMRKLGMPVISLRQDASEYFDVHHTLSDTLDKIDPEQLQQVLAAFVAATYVAAELPTDFGWLPEEEETE